jgi:ribosomal protein S11
MGQTAGPDPRESVVVPHKPTDPVVHIHATSNNTIVTVTTAGGDTLTWASAGSVGFKGAKRSTAFAAQTAGTKAAQAAMEKGVAHARVIIRGMGAGRAVRCPVSLSPARSLS